MTLSMSSAERAAKSDGARSANSPAGRHPTVRQKQRRTRSDAVTSSAFLFLAVGLVAVVLLVPFGMTVYRSFFSDTRVSTFSGLDNYLEIYRDPILAKSLINTFMWVIGSLLLPVAIGLGMAVMTTGLSWGKYARLALILPFALSGTAIAVVGNILLRTDGAINGALASVGLESWQQQWLLDWPLNTVSAILVSVWQGTGVAVVLFMVGLQTIPAETLEAAALDRAGGWRRFWHITLPQLKPVTAVVVGITLANALRTFDVIWVLTQGGPGRSSETLALSMYRETFLRNLPGQGAAIAVVLTIIVVFSSWIYLRNQVRTPA